MKLDDMTKRQVRYWLFRFKTELEDDGASASDAPRGLRKLFEGMEWFQGWNNFSVTWDVNHEEPFRIIPLKVSLDEQWNKTLEEKVPEMVKADSHIEKITKKKSKKKTKK